MVALKAFRRSRRTILALLFAVVVSRVPRVAAQAAIDAEDQDQLTQLMRASAKGDLKAVSALLAKGADPNVQNAVQRVTALMFASYFGHTPVVNALVAKGANVALKDALGAGAVDWAILGDHAALAKVFTDKGARDNPFLTLGSMPFWLMDKAAGTRESKK